MLAYAHKRSHLRLVLLLYMEGAMHQCAGKEHAVRLPKQTSTCIVVIECASLHAMTQLRMFTANQSM